MSIFLPIFGLLKPSATAQVRCGAKGCWWGMVWRPLMALQAIFSRWRCGRLVCNVELWSERVLYKSFSNFPILFYSIPITFLSSLVSRLITLLYPPFFVILLSLFRIMVHLSHFLSIFAE